jgi:hypothetical protein
MTVRTLSSSQFEQMLAILALAGLRELVQAVHVAVATSSTHYHVQHAQTRRVMCFHTSTGAKDIRFHTNATALATDMPLTGQTYWVVDAQVGDLLYFYNTTVGNVDVNIMELA